MAIPRIPITNAATRYEAIEPQMGREIVSATQTDASHSADERTTPTLTPAPSGDLQVPLHASTQGGALAIERRLRRALAPAPRDEKNAALVSTSSTMSTADASATETGLSHSPMADAAVIERLNVALTQWVDEARARPYAASPSALLQAVARHRRRDIPEAFATTLSPSLLADVAVLDEAALLYDRLGRPPSADGTPLAASPAVSLSTLRATFLAALRTDYSKRRALDTLFLPSASFAPTAPSFDGFSLRHAEGKSFDELVQMPAVWADPVLAALTLPERRALLEQKFDEMGESTRFPIGSILHSMATALLRIERYRGKQPAEGRHEPELVEAFMQCDRSWKAGDTYPYHPRLLFAAHLARSSGIEVLSFEQLNLLYENQVNDRVLDAMAGGNAAPAEWLAHYLSERAAPGVGWKNAEPALKAQALLALFDTLRDAADRNSPISPISPIARELKDAGIVAPNRIVGADFDACAAAVIEYANERLVVAYGEPPSFDRRDAAIAVLRRSGVDESDLSDPRHYAIVGDNPNLTKNAFGDLIDEFLDRADWVGLTGASMALPGGHRLRPRDELQREEEAFNARLALDPWVVALAKERLRTRSKAVTPEAVAGVANEIAGNLVAETESHRALVRGLETWINTVPVAGPLYNIEEGIRHRDAARAAFGLLFLGVDAFDVTTGGGGGARAQTVHPIVPKLRRAMGRIDASQVNVAGHPEMIEMSVDPVHLTLPDANVPPELRALAQTSARKPRRTVARLRHRPSRYRGSHRTGRPRGRRLFRSRLAHEAPVA